MPFERGEALALAGQVVEVLRPVSELITIAGSLRRGKSLVKDAEIVVLPRDLPTLLSKLDGMIARGEAKQAIYPDGGKRWGDKYRGLDVGGIKVEVFIAEPANWGYILWLRTGPGDGNTAVMTHMSRAKWPVRFMDGYAQMVSYETGEAKSVGKLKVGSEDDVFKLLGVPYMKPAERDVMPYARALSKALPPSPSLLVGMRLDAPKPAQQMSLF